MSYDDNMIHVHEREEARDARRYMPTSTRCYRCHYVPDGRGGGICVGCGETIGADEL